MRILLQVVQHANVKIEKEIVGEIKKGILLFVGFKEGDDEKTIDEMLRKVLSLRIFPDENGHTNLSLEDVHGEVLSVSQFTLYADIKKGRRPTFQEALAPEKATLLYDLWLKKLREIYPSTPSGVFGADMQVELVNDGPFTLWIDSDELRRR